MKEKTFLKLFLSLLAGVILMGCSNEDKFDGNNRGAEAIDIELTPATRAMSKTLEPTYVNFTREIIKNSLADENSDGNLATSPLSATMLLAMIANGVNEESKKEVTDYLGTEDLATLNELCQTLLAELPKADRQADITLANSLWVNKYYNLIPTAEYLNVFEKQYNGECFNYDFVKSGDKFQKELQKWFTKHTGGLINDPKETLKADEKVTLAILLNALYFKAPWNFFNKEKTSKDMFHGLKQDAEVEMMHAEKLNNKLYYVDDDFAVFSLPFANEAYDLYVALPNENLGFQDAVEKFTPEFVQTVKNEYQKCVLTISLPKFSIQSRLQLNSFLAAIGLGSITDGRNYTMFENLPDDVMMMMSQNTAFSIDEKGVEAASVSSGDFLLTANFAKPGEHYVIDVNRPFIYYIVERSTQTWITSGYVADFK